MNDTTSIAFDQYQRYQTVADLISFVRTSISKPSLRILEIGSNEHKDLRLFLPQDDILFTDLVLTPAMQQDPDFQQADGTCLSFEDNSFDFAIATDVLEHIPPEKRVAFFSELTRVATYGVLLSFPYDSVEINLAEQRLNLYYHSLFNREFSWLQEHQTNGLPKLTEIDEIISQLGCWKTHFFHGNLDLWEQMYYSIFEACRIPHTLDYLQQATKYYNQAVYPHDITPPCYRVFYVIAPQEIPGLDAHIVSLFQDDTRPASTLAHILQAHQQLVQHAPQPLDKNLHSSLFCRHLDEAYDPSRCQYGPIDPQTLQIHLSASVPPGCTDLRFDPMESACIVTRLRVTSDQGTLIPIPENALEYQGLTMFLNQDPKYFISLDGKEICHVEIEGEAIPIGSDALMRLLLQQLKHIEHLEQQQQHWTIQENALEQTKQQLDLMTHSYQTISTSFFWRATKPFRVITDIIKRPLRRFKLLRLARKGVRCWRENGTVYTMRKFKQKLLHRQSYRTVATRPLFTPQELLAQTKHVFPRDITFSIVVPLYNTPPQFLHEMIRSVLDQTYGKWQLCLADGSDQEHQNVEEICLSYAQKDARICYQKLEKNLGISGNSNACLEMAEGDYIGLFDHDDLLHPAALFEVMRTICETNADFIYTDENTFHVTPQDAYCPHFKPDYSPDTLRSYNYICHFSVFSRELLARAGGGFRAEYDGSQDYDLILRLTEQANLVAHIPEILYYWRAHANSVADNLEAKPYTLLAARKALAAHLDRMGLSGEVTDSSIPSTYRIRYDIEGTPLVSIIIPNKDHVETLQTCIRSIFAKTTYPNYEIIIVENNSTEPATFQYYQQLEQDSRVKVVVWDGPFNYSAINNYGIAQAAQGEYYLLLNNDVEILTPAWIDEMLMFAQRQDVGAVGAMLYYPDDTIQHAGVIIGLGGVAGHSHKYYPRNHPGYSYRLKLAQNLSAVTAACILIPKRVWDDVNGLDETFEVAFNDVDLCMRIRKAGYLVVWTPYAELYHYESKSRGLEDTPEKQKRFAGEIQRFHARWSNELTQGDPYYNPNLTLEREDFSIK